MLTRFLIALSLIAILPGCSSSVETTEELPPEHEPDPFLEKSTFHLPSDGTPNDNGYIGPFCCTGVSAVIQTKEGYPAGYAYFFGWEGQAFNSGDTSYAPGVEILIAGLTDPHDPKSALVESKIHWSAADMKIGAFASAKAGGVQFTATIEDVDLHTQSSNTYFDMSTLAVKLDVDTTP